MKFKVTWWIHGGGRIVRGSDIVEAKELDEQDAVELIHADLNRNLSELSDFDEKPANLPNFHKTHESLMLEDKHTEVSNWGILQIKRVVATHGTS